MPNANTSTFHCVLCRNKCVLHLEHHQTITGLTHLPTEVASVLPVLRYLYLLHHFPERGAISCTILPYHTSLLCALRLHKHTEKGEEKGIKTNQTIEDSLRYIKLPTIASWPFLLHVSKRRCGLSRVQFCRRVLQEKKGQSASCVEWPVCFSRSLQF